MQGGRLSRVDQNVDAVVDGADRHLDGCRTGLPGGGEGGTGEPVDRGDQVGGHAAEITVGHRKGNRRAVGHRKAKLVKHLGPDAGGPSDQQGTGG